MALPYVYVTRRDLGKGIDTHSPKTALPDGYAEDLENFDTSSSGKLSTRKGYEGVYGWLPLRATAVEHSGTSLVFTLPAGVDVSGLRSSSLLVSGKVSEDYHTGTTPAGDFIKGTVRSKWYHNWALEASVTLAAGSGTETVTAATHGQTSTDFWPVLFEGTPGSSATPILLDSTEIDTTTYSVDFDYTVGTQTVAYPQYVNVASLTGSVYQRSITQPSPVSFTVSGTTFTSLGHGLEDGDVVELTTTGTLPTGLSLSTLYVVSGASTDNFLLTTLDSTANVGESGGGSGTHSWTQRGWATDQATHALNTQELLVKCWDSTVNAGKVTEILPAGTFITAAGTVSVYFAADFTGEIHLVSVPATQYETQTTAGAGTHSYTGIDTGGVRYLYMQAWEYNTTMSRWDAIQVDIYTVNPTAETLAVDVTTSAAVGLKFVWVEANIIGNRLSVTDTSSTSENWEDTRPQMTLYGLAPADLYADTTSRGGHVHHLDVYRREGESTLVSGYGGVFFEGTDAGTDSYWGQGVAALEFIPGSEVNIGPGFLNSTSGTLPNQYLSNPGYVTSGAMTITSVTYDSSTRCWVVVCPKSASYAQSGFDPKWLTIAGSPHEILNTDHRVVSWSAGASTLTFNLGVVYTNEMTNAELAQYNLTTTQATLKCNFGVVPLGSGGERTYPIAGDSLVIPGINTSDPWEVKGTAGSYAYVSITPTVVTIPAGTTVGIQRTSEIVLLENSSGTQSVEGFVPGDMLTVSGVNNSPRVLYVFSESGVTGSANVSTVNSTTINWPISGRRPQAGDKIFLSSRGTATVQSAHVVDIDTSGVYEVESSNASNGRVVFTEPFVPDNTVEVSWTLKLPYAQMYIDEALDQEEVGTSQTTFDVVGRWIPIEAPAKAATTNLGEDTWTQYAEYYDSDQQTPTHSTTINDSMLLTQGYDPVLKYDGTNITEAGMPSWPLQCFARVQSGSGSISAGPTIVIANPDPDAKTFTTTYPALQVGDKLYDGTLATIANITEDSSNGFRVKVLNSDDISLWATPITVVTTYRYYVKLSMVDPNGYYQQSQVTAFGDLTVDMTTSGSIALQIIPPPSFGAHRWQSWDLEVFRTKANGAEFFQVYKDRVSWDPNVHYITVTDSLPDELLVTVDAAGVALDAQLGNPSPSGANLTNLEPPPRAATVTSLDNRAVLGNIRGWPEADVTLFPAATSTSITKANLSGSRWLVRKDSTDTGTSCNLTDRVAFEFINPASKTFTFLNTDVDVGTDVITKASHGLVTGDTVAITEVGLTGITAGTTYYVIKASSSTFKLASTAALAHAGTAVDITVAAAGTYTLTGVGGVGVYPNNFSLTTSTLVVTSVGHGLSASDWVYLFHSDLTTTTKNLRFAGWFRVDSVTTDTFTINLTVTSTTASGNDVDRWVKATTATDIPVLLGSDGNFSQRDGNPSTDSWQLQAPIRLAAAVNASQRELGTGAWLTAKAGAQLALGQLILRCPRAAATVPEILLPSSLSAYRVFVNDTSGAASTAYSFETAVFPSRVVRSFRNFSEVFHNPFGADQSKGDSIVDVNPADGQSVTTIIPMFGESATGTGSQLSQDLLVFKTASVYLVNVETRAVQRLNTRGQGCTAPRSVTVTSDGVIFANESGVYKINRDYTITTIGLKLTGFWRDSVNRDNIAEACATHFSGGRRIKLAVPSENSTYADQVLVYDYDRESSQELGAWTTYTNHTPVWWCNDGAKGYWASQSGSVFKIRDLEEASDYRDDGEAVATQVAVLKAEDFDLPGVRKSVKYVTTTVEVDLTPLTDLVVKTATKLGSTYTETGRVSYTLAQGRHQTFKTPPGSRRSTHIQVKYEHSTKDEICVISGAQYEVAQLTSKAVADTGSA